MPVIRQGRAHGREPFQEVRRQDAIVLQDNGLLMAGKQAPMMVTLFMTEGQIIAPRLMARTEKGQFVPTKFDDMWPFIAPLTYSNIEEKVNAHS